MKQLLIIFAAGLLATACGEQFQGTYTGQATLLKDSCGYSDLNKPIKLTMDMKLSGDSAEFVVTDFSKVDPNMNLNTTTAQFVRGLTMKGNIQGNNEIATSNSTYENSQGRQQSILNSLSDSSNLSEDQKKQVEQTDIYVSGSLSSDRNQIATYNADMTTAKVSSQQLGNCEIQYSVDQNGLNLVK